MNSLFRIAIGMALSAGLCAGALAAQPVSDADVSKKLDQLNATVQVIDVRLQQIIGHLNQSAQCWMDGKAFSLGTKLKLGSVNATCSVQQKTGWPEWIYTDNLDSLLVRP